MNLKEVTMNVVVGDENGTFPLPLKAHRVEADFDECPFDIAVMKGKREGRSGIMVFHYPTGIQLPQVWLTDDVEHAVQSVVRHYKRELEKRKYPLPGQFKIDGTEERPLDDFVQNQYGVSVVNS